MRRGFAAALLLLPVVEIAVAVGVGNLVGAAWTLLALAALSLAGILVLRDVGRRGWQEMREAARTGVPPRNEGRGLTVVAGLLLALPGFVTAAAGLLLMLPPVRGLVRRRARRWFAAQGGWRIADRYGRPAGAERRGTPPGGATGPVVEGEVVHGDAVADNSPYRPR